MTKITFSLTFEKVRKVLARLTGRRQEDVLANQNLVDDFGFTEVGFARLHARLEDDFSLFNMKLTDNEVSNSETVNDLLLMVWSKIPEDLKETTPFTEQLFNTEGLMAAFSEEISKTSAAKRVERTKKKKS